MRYESPRLKHFDYTGSHAYFLTMVTRERRATFKDPPVVFEVERRLIDSCNRYEVQLWAFTFMPDHLHLLAQGGHGEPITEFVRIFKQTSGFDYRQNTGRNLWQVSYYDRVLRSDEALPDVARYIWLNPVRAGICSDYREYQFSGPRPLPDLA